MGAAGAAGLAGLILLVGLYAGWHANRAHAAHGDVKSAKGRMRGGRKTRVRSGAITIGLLMIALIVLKDLARH
jgi:hypothetical protein